VRISRQVRGGKRTFAQLGPGEFFGEMAILNQRPRSATATAIEAVTVLELDATRFEAMVTTQAEIAVRIIQKLSRRLDEADGLLTILIKRDPKSRVLLGLMREAERRGRPGSTPEAVIVQRDFDDMAEELGIRRDELDETVARIGRVGLARAVEGGLELAGVARLAEFLSFLEERGIVRD
jgi:CRP-like cAMP-binding protein